jgi:hypothetical protein
MHDESAAEANDEQAPEVFLRTIEVEVSDEENTLRLVRLAQVDGEINNTEAAKASRVSDYNAELKQLRKDRNKLLEAITSRREKRDVECYQRADERRGIMAIIRKSDGKVIDERALTIEERQTQLPFRDKTPEEQEADAASAAAEDGDGAQEGAGRTNDTERPPADESGDANGQAEDDAELQAQSDAAAKKSGAGKVVRIRASDAKKRKAARGANDKGGA